MMWFEAAAIALAKTVCADEESKRGGTVTVSEVPAKHWHAKPKGDVWLVKTGNFGPSMPYEYTVSIAKRDGRATTNCLVGVLVD